MSADSTGQASASLQRRRLCAEPPKRLPLLMVLAGLSGASPLATDMYVPALPDLARSLGTDASGAHMSLTGFLAGIIVGQLLLGPLSDAIGRRPVLLGGSALFAAFSAVYALAPTVEVLNSARVGQGIAGAAGIVVSRAVVADLFDDRELPSVFSRLGAITATAPVLAPLAGGALLPAVSWRYVFAVLALLGVLLTLGVGRWIPESHPPSARLTGGPTASLRTIGQVAAQRTVLLILSGAVAATGAAALLLIHATIGSTMPLTWLCLLITISAFGVFFPAVITVAQSRGRAAPGATSALLGGGQFLFGAAASPLVGLFGTHSPAPMAAVMTGCLALGTLAAIATRGVPQTPTRKERHP